MPTARSRGAAEKDLSGVRLRTQRLHLRPLETGDVARLFEIHSDPVFMRYWSSPPWKDDEEGRRMVLEDRRGLKRGEHLRLGIVRRKDDLLIGACVLFRFDRQNRRAELGYGIAREWWRMGYMTEGVGALVAFAFDHLKLHRLEADIHPGNIASARSLEKLGFLREGYLRERWFVAGEVSDSAIYGLLASDFHRKAAPAEPRRH